MLLGLLASIAGASALHVNPVRFMGTSATAWYGSLQQQKLPAPYHLPVAPNAPQMSLEAVGWWWSKGIHFPTYIRVSPV